MIANPITSTVVRSDVNENTDTSVEQVLEIELGLYTVLVLRCTERCVNRVIDVRESRIVEFWGNSD